MSGEQAPYIPGSDCTSIGDERSVTRDRLGSPENCAQ